jgi:NTE family protein
LGSCFLNSALGVTAQMINILTEQNVQRSLVTMGERDVLVSPQLGVLTSGDFCAQRRANRRSAKAAPPATSSSSKRLRWA